MSIHMPTAIAILPPLAAMIDQDLSFLVALLKIDPLPPQATDFAPFINEARAVADFLLRLDSIVDVLRAPAAAAQTSA